MIVTVKYGDGEVTDPLEGVTNLGRDEDENLVATFSDGSKSTFVDGQVKQAEDSDESHRVHE